MAGSSPSSNSPAITEGKVLGVLGALALSGISWLLFTVAGIQSSTIRLEERVIRISSDFERNSYDKDRLIAELAAFRADITELRTKVDTNARELVELRAQRTPTPATPRGGR